MENEKKQKNIFIARLVMFCLFACVFPFAFIAWRYEIFSVGNKVSLTGWGIIALIIVLFFVKYILKILSINKKYSMTSQIFVGIFKVIVPLLVFWIIINSISKSINLFNQALICTIICEFIAIPINPLPQWIYKNDIKTENIKLNNFFESVFKNKQSKE